MPVAVADREYYCGRKMVHSNIPPCTLPPRATNLANARHTEVLHVYILDDKVEKVEDYITSKNIPVDIPNQFNQTPLFCAAYSGNERTVVKLLQLGADPNKGSGQFSRYTPVHGACYSGNPRVLSYLIESGGDLRLRDEFGRTPRDWAEGYITRADKRMEVLAVIESYRELANGGDVNPLDAMNRRKSKIPKPISQILNLPHVKQRESVPGPYGYVQATGFGDVICGRQVMMGHFPVRRILENELEDILDKNDLNSGKDVYEIASKKAVPYRCGEATQFYPHRWRDSVVTVRKFVETDLKRASPASSAQNLLIHELDNLRELNGPGILHLIGAMPVQTHTQISLVFEGVQYGSLHRYLHESNSVEFTEKRMLLLLSQIANALKLIHNMGFLHLAISSHSIHLVGPHQAKLGNLEFATKARGDATRMVYTQRPWETFRDTYWNWMSPEVLMKEVPSKASDSFSLCVVVYEVMTKKLPWADRDRDDIIQRVKQYREGIEHGGKDDTPYFSVTGVDLPTYIKSLLHRGLSVLPDNRCDTSEIYAMLRRQAIAVFRSESRAVPKRDDTSHISVPKQKAMQGSSDFSDGSEAGSSASSMERFITARDSGVFGTPEVPGAHEDDRETVVSSTSGSTFVQKPVSALVRKFSMKSPELQYDSRNSTQYHSVISSPEPPNKAFSRRLSLPFKVKKNESSSVDSSVKISVLPSGQKSLNNSVSTSSWGKMLNNSRGGILKLTRRATNSPQKPVKVEESYQHSFGATFYSAGSPLDTVDSPTHEPIYATVKKVRKRATSVSSCAPVVHGAPPPPPLPKAAGPARKPASHFCSPNVFSPPPSAIPTVEADPSRRPKSADETQQRKEHAYLRIPTEVRSVVAHPAHVIGSQNEFDRSEWQRALMQKEGVNCAATQTFSHRNTGTQTVDFRQSNSSDELKVFQHSDSDDNSSGSFARLAPRSSTPQKGALQTLLSFPGMKRSKKSSVGSYDDFSRDPHMEASSPVTAEEAKKRSVSFFEPGNVPQRPVRGKGSKDTSSSGSMYETATEVSQPEKFYFGNSNQAQAQTKARYSPPPKPLRTFEAMKPLVPYEDSMSQNTSFTITKEAFIAAKKEIVSTRFKSEGTQVSELFESVNDPSNNTSSTQSSAPTVVNGSSSPTKSDWPDSNLEKSDAAFHSAHVEHDAELPHETITENSHMCHNHAKHVHDNIIGFEGCTGYIGFEGNGGDWGTEGEENLKNENAENEWVEGLGLGDELAVVNGEDNEENWTAEDVWTGGDENEGTIYKSVIEEPQPGGSAEEEAWG